MLYQLEPTAAQPDKSLRALAQVRDGKLAVARRPPDGSAELTAAIWPIEKLTDNEAPPDAHALKFFARGVAREQYTRLPEAASAWRVVYTYPVKDAHPSIAVIDESILELAMVSSALIWDSQVRLLYSPDYFNKERVNAANANSSVYRQVTIHAYQSGDHVRAVSLGMGRFGQPDLTIEQLSWGTQKSLLSLMNGIAQMLIEGSKPDATGHIDFDVSSIRNETVRSALEKDRIGNAPLKGRFQLLTTTPAEGDAKNALMAIRFDGYTGNDEFARQEDAISQVFGWHDEIKRIEHTDELGAASKVAAEKLPQLQKVFAAGLAPGEYIQIKAPFPTPAGTEEWMWVEITEWKADAIHGLLRNEPFDIPDLHAGQKVTVELAKVFDYLHTFPDGRQEGNSTGAIIEKMQGTTEKAGTD